jgi:transcriptional antiterminator RfaH
VNESNNLINLSNSNWYCLYTKSKQEDFVARKLFEIPDIEVFSPKLKHKKFLRGRLRETVEDLFPNYIFTRFNPLKYFHMIKYTRGIRRIVGNSLGQPYRIDEQVIDLIRSRMEEGYVHIVPPRFREGDPVMVKEGPFKGLLGLFMKECKAADRVMILLNTLKYGARLEVETALLARP